MLLGHRKWSVCMTAIICAFILALLEKLTPEFATVASVACGAFVAANAATHHAGKAAIQENADVNGWSHELRQRPPHDPVL